MKVSGDGQVTMPVGSPDADHIRGPQRDGTPDAPSMPGDSYVPAPSRQVEAGKTDQTMMEKIGGQLADKYFFKDHRSKLPSLTLSNYGGIGFDTHVRPLKAEDDLIKGDPNRQRTTERLKKEGKGITWAELRGAVNPRVGFPLWVPSGPVNVSSGFSADVSLGVSILAPFRHHIGGQVSNLSVQLPFAADTARALTEGTELTLRGRGRLALTAGTRVGDSWTPLRGPWSIGMSVGADAYVSAEHELSVRVKRLDGEKVFVSIAKVDTAGAGQGFGARAGVHSNLTQLADEYALDAGNWWVDKGKDLTAKRVSREIEKWLSAEVRAVYAASESERELKNYVVDLSKPEGRKAYEALMTLDTRPADALQGRDAGIAAVWLTENAEAAQQEFRARLGRIDLLKSTARAEFADGRLYTREGLLRYDRTTLDHSYQDLITRWWLGRRETHREVVWSGSDGSNTRGQLRLRNDVKVDGSTPGAQVRRFMTLAQYIGVTTPDPSVLARDEQFLSSFGRSHRRVDFALNDKGVERLLSASDDDLKAAFAAGYEDLDRPWNVIRLYTWEKNVAWRVTPWLNTSHPRYADVIRLLEAGPESPSQDDSRRQSRDQEYYWLTGRPLWQDTTAHDESKRLVTLIGKLRQAGTSAERAKILKRESADLGVDCMREFAMLAKIAGRDGLQVGELWIKDEGRRKKLDFTSDGPIQDPRQVVDAWLAQPDTGPQPTQVPPRSANAESS